MTEDDYSWLPLLVRGQLGLFEDPQAQPTRGSRADDMAFESDPRTFESCVSVLCNAKLGLTNRAPVNEDR